MQRYMGKKLQKYHQIQQYQNIQQYQQMTQFQLQQSQLWQQQQSQQQPPQQQLQPLQQQQQNFRNFYQNRKQMRQKVEERKNRQQQQQQQHQYQHHNNRRGDYSHRATRASPYESEPSRNKYLFVSRVPHHVGTDKIKTYLRNKYIRVIDIEKVSHEFARYNSYKICVSYSDFFNMIKRHFWPSGTICKQWRIGRNDNDNNGYENNYENNYNNPNPINNNKSNHNEYDDTDSMTDDEWDMKSFYEYHY